MERKKRGEIPYLQATMCYFYLLYKHLTNKRKQTPRFKKRARCHSIMALNRATGVSAADHNWLSQTHVKNYRNFSLVEI